MLLLLFSLVTKRLRRRKVKFTCPSSPCYSVAEYMPIILICSKAYRFLQTQQPCKKWAGDRAILQKHLSSSQQETAGSQKK